MNLLQLVLRINPSLTTNRIRRQYSTLKRIVTGEIVIEVLVNIEFLYGRIEAAIRRIRAQHDRDIRRVAVLQSRSRVRNDRLIITGKSEMRSRVVLLRSFDLLVCALILDALELGRVGGVCAIQLRSQSIPGREVGVVAWTEEKIGVHATFHDRGAERSRSIRCIASDEDVSSEPACGLTKDSDFVFVAAKMLDIVLDPLQAEPLV